MSVMLNAFKLSGCDKQLNINELKLKSTELFWIKKDRITDIIIGVKYSHKIFKVLSYKTYKM
jgi:hypothetical protein